MHVSRVGFTHRFGYPLAGLAGAAAALLATLSLLSCSGHGSEAQRSSPDALRSVALAEIAALPRPRGVEAAQWQQLKAELIRQVAAAEIVFGPPDDLRSKVTDISASEKDGLLLEWTYANSGDYDQNGEVNGSDLTPMGPALLKTSADPEWTRWQLADGDANSEVNISDITPIGANFRASVESYQVQYSVNADGPFNEGGQVPLSAAEIPAGQFRKVFSFVSSGAAVGWYRVVPRFNGVSGIPSDAVQYLGPNLAPVAAVSANVQFGASPLMVSFDAGGSLDPDGTISTYAWDFDGNGLYDELTFSPSVDHEFVTAGVFESKLRVTDYRGAEDVASVQVGVLDWAFSKVADEAQQDRCRPLRIDGLPQVLYNVFESVDGPIGRHHAWLATGKVSQPQGPGDWTKHEIFSAPADSVSGFFLREIQHKPALVLYEMGPWPGPGTMKLYKFAMASIAVPGSESDWLFSDIIINPFIPAPPSLFEVGGRPALIYYDHATYSLECWVANVDNPQSATDWDVSSVESFPGVSGHVYRAVCVVDGKPVVAYQPPSSPLLKFAYANSAHPLTSADWTVGIVDDQDIYPSLGSVIECNSKPFILLQDDLEGAGRVLSPLTDQPLSPGDWAINDFPEMRSVAVLTEFDGRPMVLSSKEKYGPFWFYLATNSDPQSSTDWVSTEIEGPNPTADRVEVQFCETDDGLSMAFTVRNPSNPLIKEIWYGFCPIQ